MKCNENLSIYMPLDPYANNDIRATTTQTNKQTNNYKHSIHGACLFLNVTYTILKLFLCSLTSNK